MAIDPSIAMNVRVGDFGGAIRSGLATGEQIATRDIREDILKQRQQMGQLTLQDAQQAQALQGIQNFATVVDGLASISDLSQRAKILAQQSPMLEEAGIPASQLSTIDLSDNGIRELQISMKPFIAGKRGIQSPAAVQTFQFYQGVLNDPNTTEDQKKAARIALKLEGPARTFAPKVVDIGGSKFLQVGNEFFNPQTMAPVDTDERGLPTGATGEITEVSMPNVLTPEIQRDMKAQEAAAVAGATEAAKIQAQAGSAEELEVRRKKEAQAQKTVGVIDNIIASDRLDNITGVTGILPFSFGKTEDLLADVQQMKSLLTADNLGIMTGVLSESDMKVIEGLSNSIGLETDEGGNITRIRGSYEGTVQKLKQIRREVINGLNSGGVYVEGQTISNPDTGERMVYRGGKWQKM